MRVASRVAFALVSLGLAVPLAAQAPERQFTVLAGIGNSLGWFGGSLEAYLGSGRLTAYAGLGYTPSLESGDPSGVTLAGGLRYYTRGSRHRGYLEGGVGQIAIDSPGDASISGKRYYGPMAMVGYQHVGGSGFTQQLGVGIGFVTGADEVVAQTAYPVFTIGLGYTW